MIVQKAQKSDIDGIEKIYDRIHDSEEQGLSTIGWIRGVYPTRKTAEAALERGDLFVMADGGKVVAAPSSIRPRCTNTRTRHGSTPRKTARSWYCTALWLTH